jgi:predicted Zn-dependent peptidase
MHMSVCSVGLSAKVFPKLWMDYEERIEQLSSIKLAELAEHYQRTHTAANARFYLAGHFPDGGEKVARRLERMFDRLPRGSRLPLDRSIGLGLAKPVVARRDIAQVYYRAGVYFGELTEQERAALSVLRMLMVGGMGSRVLGEARTRGLAYSVGAVGHAEPGNSSFGFAGYVTPEHAEALFEVMARSVRAVAAGECTPEELAAAKDLLVGSITRSTQTAGDILQWYVERYDDEEEIRDFEAGLERLRSVSQEEVTKVCRQVVEAKHRAVSLVGRLNEAQTRGYAQLLTGSKA